jgi:hypothetical protein
LLLQIRVNLQQSQGVSEYSRVPIWSTKRKFDLGNSHHPVSPFHCFPLPQSPDSPPSPVFRRLARSAQPCPTQQVSVNVPIHVTTLLHLEGFANLVFPAAPPEDQARLLEEALAIVRAHGVSMKRCIDKLQILDSLKHASMMLAELRSSSLGPKHYYELCSPPLPHTSLLLLADVVWCRYGGV